MNPQDRITWSTPFPRSHSRMNEMNGRSTSGTTGFGTVEVSGRRRVPSPPARISACIASTADSLVRESGAGDARPAGVVAPVDPGLAVHPRRRHVPIELAELRPFGHEDAGIDTLQRAKCRVCELDP